MRVVGLDGREAPWNLAGRKVLQNDRTPHSSLHLRARALGSTLACFGGHNKKIICRNCNMLQGDDTLVVFLLQLLRAGDAIRAEGVAGIIADIYVALGDVEADELVGMPKAPELPKPKKRLRPDRRAFTKRCTFPACTCAGMCNFYDMVTKDASA